MRIGRRRLPGSRYTTGTSDASLRLAERANPVGIADEIEHSLEVLFSTYANVVAELNGTGPGSAEALILDVPRFSLIR